MYAVENGVFVRDGNNFTAWNAAGNNITQVNGTNITEIAYDFNLNIMTQAQVTASRPPQNTINYGIGYQDAANRGNQERSNAVPGVPGRRNSSNLNSSGAASQYQANANNPNVYINVGYNDHELRRMRNGNYSSFTRTFVHETLHMLGLGDGYQIAGTNNVSFETQGNSATQDLNGNNLTSTSVGNIMSTTDSNFTNVEAQKLHSAIVTNDYQYYNFGVQGAANTRNTGLNYQGRNNLQNGTYRVTGP